MVNRIHAKCDLCNTPIILRCQMGEFDIPFVFNCPVCSAELSGTIFVDKRDHYEFEGISMTDENAKYIKELSAEFFTHHIYENFDQLVTTPYLYNSMLVGFEGYQQSIQRLRKFFIKKQKWTNIKNNYLLICNGKWKVVANNVFNPGFLICNICDNSERRQLMPTLQKHKFAILTQVHHNLILSFSDIMPKDTLNNLTKIKQSFDECDMRQLYNHFSEHDLLNHIKRGVNIIDMWMSQATGYIPLLIALLSDQIHLYKTKDYCLTTMSIKSLLNFYADSYEYLCQILGVCVAANNILHRHDINAFPEGSINNNFDRFLQMRNTGKKIEDVNLNENFTLPLNLNNKIRNAIDHVDYDIDYNTQTISLNDNGRSTNLTFIDMQEMCLDNFKSILYAMEHLYYFLRIYYMQKFHEDLKLNLIDKND